MKPTPEVEEILEEFRNKILDVETAIRLTYNEKDSDAMVAKMLDFIATLTAKHEADKEAIRKLSQHLSVILPMAKGYVHTNDVGRNREMVSNAEDYLAWLDTPTKTDKQTEV